MGDPRKIRKKFSKPAHPWQKERIELEKKILKDYGLKRKNEIWKMDSLLRKFLYRAKMIIGEKTQQSDVERQQLLKRLSKLGLVTNDSRIEDVLNLKLNNLMERRLQTLIVRKKLAKTMSQARQFITHEHIKIGDKKITAPSYIVSVEEEPQIRMIKVVEKQ